MRPIDDNPDPHAIHVAAAYCFADIADPVALRAELLDFGSARALKGTLLIAREGINGTMAGTRQDLAAWIDRLRAIPGCAQMDVKYSRAEHWPFKRFKVRLKKEIVTLGVDGVDPVGNVGVHVDPAEWNALIADPDTIVIDTRNAYEVAIGSFAGAMDPETPSFRDFPAWFDARAAQWASGGAPKKIAMFCTGGIRCEKSTAFVRMRGFDAVYHLKGGILNYLEQVPEEESLWHGDCYVFDERIALGHGLAIGDYVACPDCGRPFPPTEMAGRSVCVDCEGEPS